MYLLFVNLFCYLFWRKKDEYITLRLKSVFGNNCNCSCCVEKPPTIIFYGDSVARAFYVRETLKDRPTTSGMKGGLIALCSSSFQSMDAKKECCLISIRSFCTPSLASLFFSSSYKEVKKRGYRLRGIEISNVNKCEHDKQIENIEEGTDADEWLLSLARALKILCIEMIAI